MAKLTFKFQSKGEFDLGEMQIFEFDKKGQLIETVDLKSILERFDGKTINISISEEAPIQVEETEEEDEE